MTIGCICRSVKLYFFTLVISGCFGNLDGAGSLDTSKLEYTITQSSSQSDPTYTLPIKFLLETKLPVELGGIDKEDLSSLSSARGLDYTISKIDSKKFEIIVYGVETAGEVKVDFKSNTIKTESGKSLVFSDVGDNSVTLISSTINSIPIKSFNKVYNSSSVQIIGEIPSKDLFFYKSNSEIYVTNGSGSEYTKLINGTASVSRSTYTQSGFSSYDIYSKAFGEKIYFSGSINNEFSFWESDGTVLGTKKLFTKLPDGSNFSLVYPEGMYESNGYLYLLARGTGTRVDLVRYKLSDGSYEALSTYPVNAYSAYFIGSVNNKVLFNLQIGSDRTLYVTDGTPTGTEKLIVPTESNAELQMLSQRSLELDNGDMLLVAFNKSLNKYSTYSTDGTVAGTKHYSNIPISENLDYFIGNSTYGWKIDNDIYVVRGDAEFHKIDQTTLNLTKNFEIPGCTPWDEQLNGSTYFYVYCTIAGSLKLYSVAKSDFTVTLLKDFLSTSNTSKFVGRVGDRFYYYSKNNGGSSREFYYIENNTFNSINLEDSSSRPFLMENGYMLSDGTFLFEGKYESTGVLQYYKYSSPYVTELANTISSYHHTTSALKVLNGSLFFVASDSESKNELWVSKGSANSTKKVSQTNFSDFGVKSSKFFSINGNTLLAIDDNENGSEFWESDGSALGTKVLKTSVNGPGGIGLECDTTGNIFVCADEYGKKIWKSDGSEAGTGEIPMNANAVIDEGYFGRESVFSVFYRVGNTLYFNLYDPSLDSPTLPMKTDGSSISRVGPNTYETDYSAHFATDGTNVLISNYWDGVLFTNGNPGSAVEIGPIIEETTFMDFGAGSNYIIDGNDSSYNRKLFVSDGTVVGTKVLKQFNPGSGDSFQLLGAGVFSKYLLLMDDNVNSKELWISDGTTAGTVLLKDISTGGIDDSSYFIGNSNTHSILYLNYDGRKEIWSTNTLGAGTVKLLDGEYILPSDDQVDSVQFSGKLIFNVRKESDPNCYLYSSDGTIGGTEELAVSSSGYCPDNYLVTSNYVYFLSKTDSEGVELWRTNATAAGTAIYHRSIVGSSSLFGKISPKFYQNGTQLLFWGDEPINGTSIWSTNIED